MRVVLHLLLSPGGKLLAPWSAVRGVHLAGRVVHHRCQGCSDRLLLVSPPRAQSSLPATLSSSHHGLPARLSHEVTPWKKGNANLSEPGGGGGGGSGAEMCFVRKCQSSCAHSCKLIKTDRRQCASPFDWTVQPEPSLRLFPPKAGSRRPQCRPHKARKKIARHNLHPGDDQE